MRKPTLLDRWGNPVERQRLSDEVAVPTVTGVRSPISGYPADGLNPVRLASILREADAGDPLRYLELAETIEERDPHYLGVLGTRRRSVSQIDVSVEAASDAAADVKIADTIRDWLRRDELTEELFDILDCIGKGYSFTEIIWDTSEGQWQPARLEWRDPRWFRFERANLATPLLLSDHGTEVPLPAYKFIFASIKAKSGIVLRSGLARAAAWAWMFKAFTQRDWAIFTQTYGQPLRLGKFGPDASEADKATLFRAVANIAGDCAAIIPEGMAIEFVETKSVGQTSDLYERRADWLDKQVSKAVLGQTATTDAVTGGLGSGKEHRQVQEDIERADARALSAILNRDLIRPWVDLEFGPQKRYPRIVIARPEKEDLTALVNAVTSLVPLGLRVEQSEMRDRLGLSEPAKDAEILSAPRPAPAAGVGDGQDGEEDAGGNEGAKDGGKPPPPAPQSAGATTPPTPADLITDRLAGETAPAMGRMLAQIEAMLAAAGSLEEFRVMLLEAYPELDAEAFAGKLGEGLLAAHLGGRASAEDESA